MGANRPLSKATTGDEAARLTERNGTRRVGGSPKSSSGGVLPEYSETAWIPLEVRTCGSAGKVEVVS